VIEEGSDLQEFACLHRWVTAGVKSYVEQALSTYSEKVT
jgi:hypothetical protein